MDDNLQKAYEKFRAYVTNPVAGPSDTAQIESILVEIAAAYTAGKLEIGKTCAAFKEFVGVAKPVAYVSPCCHYRAVPLFCVPPIHLCFQELQSIPSPAVGPEPGGLPVWNRFRRENPELYEEAV